MQLYNKKTKSQINPSGMVAIPSSALPIQKESATTVSKIETRRYFIIGERRISNYWWASVIFLGSVGFLLTGISAYFKYNFLEYFFYHSINSIFLFEKDATNSIISYPSQTGINIAFFPQGLLMC